MERRICRDERKYDNTPVSNAAACGGKVALSFSSLKAILRRGQTKGKRRVGYLCPNCKSWHIGNPPKKGLRTPRSDGNGA